jgi:hypothetical protein
MAGGHRPGVPLAEPGSCGGGGGYPDTCQQRFASGSGYLDSSLQRGSGYPDNSLQRLTTALQGLNPAEVERRRRLMAHTHRYGTVPLSNRTSLQHRNCKMLNPPPFIQIRIRIRIRKLDPDTDPHQFADDKQNVGNMSMFEHLFNVLSLYFEARIRIGVRIRITVKCRSRIRIRITASVKED